MQIWAESGKSALPICNYSQILYQFLTFTQNLKRSHPNGLYGSPKSADATVFPAYYASMYFRVIFYRCFGAA